MPRRELEIAELSDRVAQLEREKDDLAAFAAVAAHELLQPLVMIEAHSAMLRERLKHDELAEARQDVDNLSRTAARLRRLVESVLHDARSSGQALRRSPVDLDEVLAEAVALMSPDIDARGARVVAGALPTVSGDEALLASLTTNLLTNALKYGPPGNVIHVGASRENDMWRVTVEDSGAPIPNAERGRIFEPFRRGSSGRRVRGVGLGLATCRRIVERHGGTIGVTVGEHGGTAFTFTLPA